MDEKMRDLLEFAGFSDIKNVVAAIVQIVAGPADRAQGGVASDHAGQRHRFLRNRFYVRHVGLLCRLPAARWIRTGASARQSKMPCAALFPSSFGSTAKVRSANSPALSAVNRSTVARKRSCSCFAITSSANVLNFWM